MAAAIFERAAQHEQQRPDGPATTGDKNNTSSVLNASSTTNTTAQHEPPNNSTGALQDQHNGEEGDRVLRDLLVQSLGVLQTVCSHTAETRIFTHCVFPLVFTKYVLSRRHGLVCPLIAQHLGDLLSAGLPTVGGAGRVAGGGSIASSEGQGGGGAEEENREITVQITEVLLVSFSRSLQRTNQQVVTSAFLDPTASGSLKKQRTDCYWMHIVGCYRWMEMMRDEQ